jgi:hypothetical protein
VLIIDLTVIPSADQNEDRQFVAMNDAGGSETHLFVEKQSVKD